MHTNFKMKSYIKVCIQTYIVLYIRRMQINYHTYINFTYLLTYFETFYQLYEQFFLHTCKGFDLIFLLTFKREPHLNTQTSFHSLHTFKTNIYTYSDKRIRQYRPAFIRLYIQSYKRVFHTHIGKCIATCLQTDMDRTLQACNDSCVHTFLLNRHKTSIINLYNLQTSKFSNNFKLKKHTLMQNNYWSSFTQSNGHAVKSSS